MIVFEGYSSLERKSAGREQKQEGKRKKKREEWVLKGERGEA